MLHEQISIPRRPVEDTTLSAYIGNRSPYKACRFHMVNDQFLLSRSDVFYQTLRKMLQTQRKPPKPPKTVTQDFIFRYLPANPLTHWGRAKMTTILQTIISNAFPRVNEYIHIFRSKVHWIFFSIGPISTIASMVWITAWRRPGYKPVSEPMIVRLTTDYL